MPFKFIQLLWRIFCRVLQIDFTFIQLIMQIPQTDSAVLSGGNQFLTFRAKLHTPDLVLIRVKRCVGLQLLTQLVTTQIPQTDSAVCFGSSHFISIWAKTDARDLFSFRVGGFVDVFLAFVPLSIP